MANEGLSLLEAWNQEDFKRNFWRSVVNVPADKHKTMADAVKDALGNEKPQRRLA